MKKIIAIILLLLSFSFQAQDTKAPDLSKMSREERQAYMRSLPPEQRKNILEDALTAMLIKRLEIPAEKQQDFKNLYLEFQDSQKAINKKFKPSGPRTAPSDAEARKMLSQSFELGQQLLDNRKAYTERFLKILTPQQVLKLYKQEKEMKDNAKALQNKRPRDRPRDRPHGQ